MDTSINLQPLPTGEHPWAQTLWRARKLVWLSELLLTITLTLILLGGNGIDAAVTKIAQWLPNSIWLKPLLFCALLGIAYGIALFPLHFIRSRIIDVRFGLSTQNFKGWLGDQIKGLLLGATLGSIVLLFVTASLQYGGNAWWLWVALGALVFGVLLTRLAPQLILPLFFKLKPVASSDLQESFRAMAARTGTPVLGIFEIDLSRRTKAANAAVIGFGATRKAVVGDTLLKEFTKDEVEFVLAHELAHHHFHDLWSGITTSTILLTLSLLLTHIALKQFALTQGITFPIAESATPVDLRIFFYLGVCLQIFGALFAPIGNAFSRYAESRADRFAAQTTGNPHIGANAFMKLGFQNIAVLKPPRWEELLLYTHPRLDRRINRLKTMS